jgi:DNA-binding NtrC family response regulator
MLVVDDEASIRELFSTVFTEADYEVIAAEGGKSATTNQRYENTLRKVEPLCPIL